MSPVAQFQLQGEDEQGLYVAEEELTNEEAIKRLQETVTLIDLVKEADVLEKKLREVRDLEERLQEVDEMATRIQEVIEEELGKEEIDKLREEVEVLERERQIQAEGMSKRVVKKSERRVESKEEEVDELEEQIKQVFLKGLLPEEEEVEAKVKQESEREVKEESLLDDSLREKLRQIEKEWQTELEEKTSSLDVSGTTSVVAYQKMERSIKKRVTVEERGQREEDMQDLQVQTDVKSEERLEKGGTWTETVEVITEKRVTKRLQSEDPSQVADKDDWFILLDSPPYKAVVKPPGTVCHCANSFSPLLIHLIL